MANPDDKRDIIPIWASTVEASKLPELRALRSPKNQFIFTESTTEILKEFSRAPEAGVAAELLNISILERRDAEAIVAAEFIINQEGLPVSLQNLARKTLGLGELHGEIVTSMEISKLRSRLNNNPRDVLAWVDLARSYTIGGHNRKADRAMATALKLCNGHRWITRAATRMYSHQMDLDKAHSILVANQNIRTDPWLIATELAVSRMAGKPLRLWRIAKNLAEQKLDPIHLSELSSSIGTSELLGGASKKAKKYFQVSLIAPTKNSLAQAKWVQRTSKLDLEKLIESSLSSGIQAFEAIYWDAYSKKQMQKALHYAKEWLKQEPYSPSPANAIAHIGSLLNKHQDIYEATESALIANPGEKSLKLNSIYAWIAITDFSQMSNRQEVELEGHIKTLRHFVHGVDKYYAAHATANIGMLCYRLNQMETGRRYYEASEELFMMISSATRLTVLLNHFREALIAEAPWANDLLLRTSKTLTEKRNHETPAVEFFLSFVSSALQEPGTWRDKFSRPIADDEFHLGGQSQSGVKKMENTTTRFWLPEDITNSETIISLLGQDVTKKNKS